ncbi:MAG: DUF6763 family protein [Porticoccaceae bacterium]|nr:hypothetical protein [Pseudomonadales bacterium]MCP5171540.1 hypothetical protein [Pseudomonadales bacterium]
MATQVPNVGQWYQDAAEDQIFEVVAVDEHAGTIEIQYLEGELSEVDLETWQQLVLLPAQPPEDWRASYEMSLEDSLNSDDIYIPDSADDPLSFIEPDSMYGIDDFL